MKIAIIGNCAGKGIGRFYDRSWTIWGMNSVHRREDMKAVRWAAMFNLHRIEHLKRDCLQYVQWDSNWSRRHPKIPVYVIDRWQGLLKRERIFPGSELKLMPRGYYHASSFDWMVALAIRKGAKAIDIHGAQFALDSPREEPISARACLEYWCGYATGLGIEVNDYASELFIQYHIVASKSVYGYDDVHMVEDRTRID